MNHNQLVARNPLDVDLSPREEDRTASRGEGRMEGGKKLPFEHSLTTLTGEREGGRGELTPGGEKGLSRVSP